MTKRAVKKDILSGNWKSLYDWGSGVEYRIEKKNIGYVVKVRDSYDGEHADVLETKWNARRHILSFAAYWKSSGRFLRCSLRAVTESQIELTYTYTDQEVLERISKIRA